MSDCRNSFFRPSNLTILQEKEGGNQQILNRVYFLFFTFLAQKYRFIYFYPIGFSSLFLPSFVAATISDNMIFEKQRQRTQVPNDFYCFSLLLPTTNLGHLKVSN